MTKKNRGLLVSAVAGLIAIVLLVAVLLLHAFEPAAASEGATEEHASEAATTPSSTHTPETMVMSDGSVMNMDDMGSTADPSDVAAGSAAETAETAQHSMGGAVDWQVIGLILALVAACISLATVLNAYLRGQMKDGAFRQMNDGAFSEGGAGNG
ncbi:MAG: hypothetical protein A2133_04890 [Actinobacteria bacterium RBG_16_64_13]|nr:MAG: hypothetical protein A2133_04890 [Actinobacteria bacterium RBG_16_64_13]